MEMFLKTTALIFLAHFSQFSSAEIYKCTDQYGQPEYSDRPCAEDAEVIEVNTSSSGINLGSQGDFSEVKKNNDLYDSERKISRLEKEIKKLGAQRDTEVTELYTKLQSARDNRLNAAWIQTLSTDIQTVSKDYNAKIQSKRDEINQLYAKRRQLKD